LCARMGTTVVSVYPYQLGHENEEAIESGAFWFYRKLGFRPGRAELRKLVEREEKKIGGDPKYRTNARTLKRLAASHVFYDLTNNGFHKNEQPEKPAPQVRIVNHGLVSPAKAGGTHRGMTSPAGAWNSFSTRNIGLRVNERMAREFGGDADLMRAHTRQALERVLGTSTSSFGAMEKATFENFALFLSPREIRSWNKEEKDNLLQIIRAKTKPDEMLYLRLTQRHKRLRQTLLTLGS
ncbi:MAG: hypothetical protein WBS24_10340, partial [Terriglobales bacterium]